MYVSAPEFDSDSLLQGDIIHEIQIFGALNYAAVSHAVPSTGGDPAGWSVSAKPEVRDAMVLSHSCEVAKDNDVKVTSIILAPLRDVSSATSPDRVQELIQSNRIDIAGAS